MDEGAVLRVLQDVGAFRAGHFVFTSGLHADTYINKDALYPHVKAVSQLCKEIATRFADEDVDVVIGPAYGAIILSTWTAYHLTEMRGRDVYGVYADKVEGGLAIRRGYDKLIAGKRTLVVEDLTTTGGSIKKVIEAARAAGADLVGAAAICNRGDVAKEQIGDPPRFEALVKIHLDQWPEGECELCANNIPVNTDIGHGSEFLKNRGA
ncbi:phosphoribosyltransferase [Candidatus Parcubacteria bacterium]|nr:MAG: phosphoribosyltransferase [Candidatus Parcubacteria bacterium]